jgi:hypothetical protein
MRRLWASPAFERSQKIAQTALVWLIPGSYLAVRQAIMEGGLERPPEDATHGTINRALDWTYADYASHHHGSVSDFDGHTDVPSHHGGGGDHGGGHDGH